METFITSVCVEDPTLTITCNYGGVLLYSLVFLFLVLIFSVSIWISYKIIRKII